MTENYSIEIKDLKVAYGEVVVLENMDLDIEDGEFLVAGSPRC